MPGQTNQINLTITNSGLIAAQGLNLYFGTHPDWSIQPLASSLGDLAPHKQHRCARDDHAARLCNQRAGTTSPRK